MRQDVGARRRLERLEAARGAGETPYEVPMTTLLYLKAVERYRAHERGDDPPAYTQEELGALHEHDLETVAGRGAVGSMRASAGWKSSEGRELLGAWEEDARQRLARLDAGESLDLVYDEDEGGYAEG